MFQKVTAKIVLTGVVLQLVFPFMGFIPQAQAMGLLTVPTTASGAEDSNIPLNITVDPVLTNGGPQFDVVATEVGFRDASAGSTATSFTIPVDTIAVRITGYGGNDNGGNSDDEEDYQTTSLIVDLNDSVYSGHIFTNYGQSITMNDDYSFSDTLIGSASTAGNVEGDTDNNLNVITLNVIGTTLSIVETQTVVDQVYFVEYLSSMNSSANFLGTDGTFLISNQLTTTGGLDPASDYAIVSMLQGEGGLGSQHEDKGLGRFYIDRTTGLVSGILHISKGRSGNNTAAYGFTNYDITSGVDILSSSATTVGDITANATALPNWELSISGDILTMTRPIGAAAFTTLFSIESYDRLGVGSNATSLGATTTSGNYQDHTSIINTFDLDFPGSAKTGIATISMSNISGSSTTNENSGVAQVFIDLENEETSGSFLIMRTTDANLVSWSGVPFGTRVIDHANTVSSPSDINLFQDELAGVIQFDRIDTGSGEVIRMTAIAIDGTNSLTDVQSYNLGIQALWSGRIAASVGGAPSGGTFTHGAISATSGELELDPSELPLLGYIPTSNFSGSGSVMLIVDYEGESHNIEVFTVRVADAPLISTGSILANTGAINTDIDISSGFTASLVDVDGSETITLLELNTIPVGHIVSDGSNSFISTLGVSTVNITTWNLGALVYQSPTVGTFNIGVRAQSTDDDGFSLTNDTAETTASFDVIIPAFSDNNTVFDNGKRRFGNNGANAGIATYTVSEDSVDPTNGNLRQPFYYDLTANLWYKLTYSTYQLDNAIAIGGDGTNLWNLNGELKANEVYNPTIDESGFIFTADDIGYGEIVTTGTMIIDGQQVEVKNTITLAETAAYTRIITKITNTGTGNVANLRHWIGTRDDWVGTSDSPTKTKGKIVDGAFTGTTTQMEQSNALKIESAGTAVLFLTTYDETKTNTIVQSCCSFANAYNSDPTTSQLETTNDGAYGLYVRLEDLAPGESDEFPWYYAAGPSAEINSIISEVTSAAAADSATPIIISPSEGEFINDATPTVTGTGVTGEIISVYNGSGTLLSTGTVDGSGNYDITLPTLPQGLQLIDVTATASGAVESGSSRVNFTVDTIEPVSPTVDTPTNFSPLTGAGEVGSIVTITDGSGSLVGTGVVDGSGNFSITPNSIPSMGDVLVNLTDEAENTSSDRVISTGDIDIVAPSTPTVNTPTNFSSLIGTGEAGTTVTIYDNGGGIIGTGIVSGSETFSITSSPIPSTGDVSVTLTDDAGNESSPAVIPTGEIDIVSPGVPTIMSPTRGDPVTGLAEAGSEVVITTSGGVSCTTIATASGSYSCSLSGALINGEDIYAITTDLAGNMSGTGSAGGGIDILAPATPSCSSLPSPAADGQTATTTCSGVEAGGIITIPNMICGSELGGNVSCSGTVGSGVGKIAMSDDIVILTDAAGNINTSETTHLNLDSIPPDIPTSAIDLQDISDTGISNSDNITTDTTPSFDVVCTESGSTITLYSGTGSIGTHTCSGTGTQIITSFTSLSIGVYEISYTETDISGNQSGNSPSLDITVDTLSPSLPTVPTLTNFSPLTGTGEVGTTVTIYSNTGSVIGTGTVSESGTFSITPNPIPSTGNVNVTLTDDAGNESSPTVIPTGAIDVVTPVSPTVTTPTNFSPLTGTGEPGVKAVIYSASGSVIGTGTVSGSGTYSIALSPVPSAGPVIIETVDQAGNTSTTVIATGDIDIVSPISPTVITPTNFSPLTGTGEIGTIVTITDGSGSVVGTGAVDGNGNFNITPNSIPSVGDVNVILTDDAGNESTPAVISTGDIDVVTPLIMEGTLSSSTTDTNAVLSWETSEITSSEVVYGLTSTINITTGEQNISPRLTSHSLTLPDLLSCTTYYYQTVSRDEAGNEVVDGIYTFSTTGCIGNAPVVSQASTNPISSSFGGIVNTGSGHSNIELQVPAGYSNNSACASGGAYFQTKILSSPPVVRELGIPADTPIFKAVKTYELSAYCSTHERLTSFDQPITITLSYSNDDLGFFTEDELSIYRFNTNTSVWDVLDNCSIDKTANTVTCETINFSTFGIFGSNSSSSNNSSSNKGSYSSNHQKSSSNNDNESSFNSAPEESVVVDTESETEAIDDITNIEIPDDMDNEEGIDQIIKTAEISFIDNDYDTCSVVSSIQNQDYMNGFETGLIDGASVDSKILSFEKAGVISGDSDKAFGKDKNTSRAELLKLILKTHCIDYSDQDTSNLDFIDVDNNSWQAKVIAKSLKLGIITGDTIDIDMTLISENNIGVGYDLERVNALKIALSKAGLYSGEISPYYGSDLVKAVYDFQLSHGIVSNEADAGAGFWGPKTRDTFISIYSGTKRVFRPNDSISQIEALKIMINFSQVVLHEYIISSYKGVPADWQHKYLLAAESLGIISAVEDNYEYASIEPVRREELVIDLYNIIQFYK